MYYLSHIGTLCPCKPKQSHKKKLQVLPYNTRSHTNTFILLKCSSCSLLEVHAGFEDGRRPDGRACPLVEASFLLDE